MKGGSGDLSLSARVSVQGELTFKFSSNSNDVFIK